MRIVALETSGLRGSVAALDGHKLLFQTELNASQRSAQSLAPTIEAVLAAVGWRARDVELFAVTQGPGSFTGLRVGVTTAKTMAYALDALLIGVNSLEAIAEQAPAEIQRLAVGLDAQRGEVYASQFCRDAKGEWQPDGEMAIVPIESWLANLPEGIYVMGPVLGKISPESRSHLTCAPEGTWMPMAEAVGRVAWRRFQAGERSDPFELMPLYLRRSAAEEKADAPRPAANPPAGADSSLAPGQ